MLDDVRLHQALLGKPGSRHRLNTPVLVIDRDALDRNIAVMATFAKEKGVRLRPHAKTHKSADIARRQIVAGAIGVCCAKLGEAEALADQGIDSILITSPVVSAPAITRLAALNERVEELLVVVDHPSNADALSQALGKKALSVLIDVDPGIKRTGVPSAEAALALWKRITGTKNLAYKGVQYYCGLQQHIGPFRDRREAIVERTRYLQSIIELLAQHGGAPEVISGSGTGTHRIDAELGVFNEWQVGSYIFMDRQYAECELAEGPSPYGYSLFVDARIVSANTTGIGTSDAGFKALATDGGSPVVVGGAPEGATFLFMGDEHGAIIDPSLKHAFELGGLVRLAVPHCDPTVNLYDTYHVVSGDTLVEIWPVTARGRSR